jgi:thioredoxin-related protein
MKKLFIPFLTLCAFWIAFKSPSIDFNKDAEQGIQFHKGTWKEALEQAKAENKLIFLDIYAVWCGPCKQMKSNTFSDAKVGEYFNKNFINVALDGEKAEGYKLANDYAIKGFPSLFFIDYQGNIIKRTSGYHGTNELIQFAKSVSKK